MAGFMKNAMSYLGMSDVAEDDDFTVDKRNGDEDTPITAASSSSSSRTSTPFPGKLSRITTIHPKSYEDAQMVGRAIRDGVPVVLNLTDVSEAVAYRIVDFSAGVVFGVHGSMERVTPRVFLLSPSQINIKVEETGASGPSHDLFAD